MYIKKKSDSDDFMDTAIKADELIESFINGNKQFVYEQLVHDLPQQKALMVLIMMIARNKKIAKDLFVYFETKSQTV